MNKLSAPRRGAESFQEEYLEFLRKSGIEYDEGHFWYGRVGGPGIAPRWTRATKTAVGTAYSTGCAPRSLLAALQS